jgi:hypothetical protein
MFGLKSGLLFRFLGAPPLCGVGLSAPICFAALRKFRCNPLRGITSGKTRQRLRLAGCDEEAPAKPELEKLSP